MKPRSVRELRFSTLGGPLAGLESRPDGSPSGTAVLVPGFTGSKEDFLPLLAPLAIGGIRVVCYDQRGQYESPGLADPAGYSLPAFGRDLWQVLAEVAETADGEPLHVLGHSFGGMVLREALLQADGGGRRPRPQLASVAFLGSGPDRIAGMSGARARLLFGVSRFLTLAQIQRIIPADDHPDPDVSRFLLARWLGNDRAGVRAMAQILLNEPDRTEQLADRLRELGLPVLVSCGEAETTWPTAQQREMAQRLGAPFVGFPGIGHSPNTDCPDLLAAALLDFWLPS
ncbi:MAG TPA: alpha/beta hydrolase [Actinocrinis sp.]|nr:alpha/beta hydrolase [Actinocrinis sp.]